MADDYYLGSVCPAKLGDRKSCKNSHIFERMWFQTSPFPALPIEFVTVAKLLKG